MPKSDRFPTLLSPAEFERSSRRRADRRRQDDPRLGQLELTIGLCSLAGLGGLTFAFCRTCGWL